MNELNNKIDEICFSSDTDREIINKLSKLFLDGIKEAYVSATKEVLSEEVYSSDKIEQDANDYLKSKYKI